MLTVSAVLTEAVALLNDNAKVIFTDSFMLPLVKKAYQELQDEMALNGLQDIKEADFTFTSAAQTFQISSVSLPADFIIPITLWVKPDGAADTEFTEMTEYDFPPDTIPDPDLPRYWRWQDLKIEWPILQRSAIFKVKYIKFLTAIVDVNTTIPVINCQTFLAARAAAIAAFILGNPERADALNMDAQKRLQVFIATLVKRQQNAPTRRQPFNTGR